MQRRQFITAAAAALSVPALVSPAQAAPVSLDALSAYLNGLVTAQTRFVQLNADGTRSQGKLFIHRPGRMRFEYDPPDEALVLASGSTVAIFDAKSNSEPTQFPLRRTPLNLILGRNINLRGDRMVFAHTESNGLTVVSARDPKQPDAGSIEMFFQPDPIELKSWIVTDESGSRTRVDLGPLETGMSFGSSLFSIEVEIGRRG